MFSLYIVSDDRYETVASVDLCRYTVQADLSHGRYWRSHCQHDEFTVNNYNLSKIFMGNFFAVMLNSQTCRILLKWLDFACEILPSNIKCDCTFTQNAYITVLHYAKYNRGLQLYMNHVRSAVLEVSTTYHHLSESRWERTRLSKIWVVLRPSFYSWT